MYTWHRCVPQLTTLRYPPVRTLCWGTNTGIQAFFAVCTVYWSNIKMIGMIKVLSVYKQTLKKYFKIYTGTSKWQVLTHISKQKQSVNLLCWWSSSWWPLCKNDETINIIVVIIHWQKYFKQKWGMVYKLIYDYDLVQCVCSLLKQNWFNRAS